MGRLWVVVERLLGGLLGILMGLPLLAMLL